MLMFLGDLTFVTEIFVLGIGMVILDLAKKENSNLLRGAGWIMSVAALLCIICTGYFFFKYYFSKNSYALFSGPFMHHDQYKGEMMHGLNRFHHGGMMMNYREMGETKMFQSCINNLEGKMMGQEQIQMMKRCMTKYFGEMDEKPKKNLEKED